MPNDKLCAHVGEPKPTDRSTAQKHKNSWPQAVVEGLEQRILYSADIAGIALNAADSDPYAPGLADQQTEELLNALSMHASTAESADESDATSDSLEIVFLDAAVPDKESVLADLIKQQENGRQIEIIIIQSTDNGLAKITSALEARTNLSAVHIISHGNESGVVLGDDWLDHNTATAHKTQLSSWKDALTVDADILFYGCDLAASPTGILLLEELAAQTGADIAASNDSTGHKDLQGNWTLEFRTGSVETEIALSEGLLENWDNQLPVTIVALPDDLGDQLSGSSIVLNDPVNAPNTNVLENDQSSAPAIQLLSFTSPGEGNITNVNGEFTYHANPGYTGADQFEYTVTDSNQPIWNSFPLDSEVITDETGRDSALPTPPGTQPALVDDALVFDGNDYIEISDADYADSFTLSMDLKIGDVRDGFEQIFQHGTWLETNSIGIYTLGIPEIAPFVEASESLFVSVYDSNDEGAAGANIDIGPLKNQWFNLTVTHNLNPESGEAPIRVFVNGADQGYYDDVERGGDPINPTGNMQIGRYYDAGDDSGRAFLENIQIKNFRIYNDVVSANDANEEIFYSTGDVSLNLRDPNAAPAFSSLNDNPLYTEDLQAVALDSDVTIFDTELSAADNFNGATLTLQRAGAANPDDSFSHLGNLQSLTEGDALTYTDPIDGTITLGTVVNNSDGLLLLEFNSMATNQLTNTVMQSIAYANTNDIPPLAVDIDWTFTDGYNGPVEFGTSLSATGTTTVNIEQSPDFSIQAPAATSVTNEDVILQLSNEYSVSHDQQASSVFTTSLAVDHGSLRVTDFATLTVNGQDTSTLTISGDIANINNALNTVVYHPANHYAGVDTLTLSGFFDTHPAIVETNTANLFVDALNDAPAIKNADNSISFDIVNSTPTVIAPSIRIEDIEIDAGGTFAGTTISLSRIGATGQGTGPSGSANPADVFSSALQPLNLAEGTALEATDGSTFGLVSKNSAGELLLLFNANANATKIESLLQSILYTNSAGWPPQQSTLAHSAIDLQWSFNDNGNDQQGDTAVFASLSTAATTVVDITAPGQPPQQIKNTGVSISAGALNQLISESTLSYADFDATTSEIEYTITSSQPTGHLSRNGVVLGNGDSFTQNDLVLGLINYTVNSVNPGTNAIALSITGSQASTTDILQVAINIADSGPEQLQSGIQLNMDGGNDAFLGDTSGYEFVDGNSEITWEFIFSGLQANADDLETTLYSAANSNTHFEHLVLRPIPGTSHAILEWDIRSFNSQPDRPVITAHIDNIFDGSMHSVALTLDLNAGGKIELYANGSLAQTVNTGITSNTTAIGQFPWVIGQQLLPGSSFNAASNFNNYVFDQGKHFSGTMHDVRIWNTVRTADEIDQSRFARFDYDPLNTANLSVNWQMNDYSGDEHVTGITDSTPSPPLPQQPVNLLVGHANGAGFIPSTPTDELSVMDTANNGDVVGYVMPRDSIPDIAGYNFTILSGGNPTPFSIDQNTGQVTVTDQSLLSGVASHYDLTINVESTDTTGQTHNEQIAITIEAINEAPAITLGSSTLNYREDDDAVVIDPTISVSDPELGNTSFAGSSLFLERFDSSTDAAIPNADDLFSSDLLTTGSPLFTATQSSGQLLITFNAGATNDDVNGLLQSIKYRNTSHHPDSNITLRWLLDDGNITNQGAGGALATAAFTQVAIEPVNDIPLFGAIDNPFTSTNEGTAVTITFTDLLAAASDIDGTISGFEVTSIANGSLLIGGSGTNTFINASHSAEWTPPLDENGLINGFSVVAVDDLGATSGNTEQVMIQVVPVSDYPVGSNNTIIIDEDTPHVFSAIDFGFSDVDNDPFESVRITAIAGGTVNLNDTQITTPVSVSVSDIDNHRLVFIPSEHQYGHSASVAFQVIDGGVNSTDPTPNTVGFAVSSVNDPPEVTGATITLTEDSALILTVDDFGFSDTKDQHPDKITGDAPYEIIFDTVPSTGTLSLDDIPLIAGDSVRFSNVSNALVYQPEINHTADTFFNFRVTDDGDPVNERNISTTASVINLLVTAKNDSPSFDSLRAEPLNFLEGDPPIVIEPTITVTDPELTETSFSGSTLILERYDLTNNLAIPNSDDQFSSAVFGSGSTLFTATQVNGQLHVEFMDGATNDDVNIVLQSIRYSNASQTPDTEITLRWTFNDNNINEQGTGGALFSTAFTQVNVELLNEAPELANLATPFAAIEEGGTLTITYNDLLAAANDIDGTVTGFEVISTDKGTLMVGGNSSNTAINSTNDANWTTPIDTHGLTRAFSVVAVDNLGAKSATPATVYIQIENISDHPVGSDLDIAINEDTPHQLNIADFGFFDVDDDTFDAVKVTAVTGGTVLVNSITMNTPGVVTAEDISSGLLAFKPSENQYAHPAFLEFQVIDSGTNSIDPVPNRLTFIVASVNDSPTVSNTSLSLNEDSFITLTSEDFAFYDTKDHYADKPGGDQPSEVILHSIPAHGNLRENGSPLATGDRIDFGLIRNNGLTYHPAQHNNTDTSFEFSINDSGDSTNALNQSNTATINFQIIPVSDSPLATDFSIDVFSNQLHIFSSAEFGFSDPEDNNNLASVELLSLPAEGILSLNGATLTTQTEVPGDALDNGLFVYHPPLNAQTTLATHLNFRVKDDGDTQNNGSNTSAGLNTLSINIDVTPDSASVEHGSIATLEDSPLTLREQYFGFDDINPGETFSLKFTSLPDAGDLTFEGHSVTESTVVDRAGIEARNLVFTPVADATGAPYTEFRFQSILADVPLASAINGPEHRLSIDVVAVDDAPTASDHSLSMDEDTSYTFGAKDFPFTDDHDTPPQPLSAVKIVSLPEAGELYLNDRKLTESTTISATDLRAGNLRYEPLPDATGQNYTAIEFKTIDTGTTSNGGSNTSENTASIVINVSNINDPPKVIDSTLQFAATINQPFSFDLPTELFTDPDPNDTITLTATGTNGEVIPEWLTISKDFIKISGTAEQEGTFEIQVSGTDSSNTSAQTTINLIINAQPGIAAALETIQEPAIPVFEPPQNRIDRELALPVEEVAKEVAQKTLPSAEPRERTLPDASNPFFITINESDSVTPKSVAQLQAVKHSTTSSRVDTEGAAEVVQLEPVAALLPLSELIGIDDSELLFQLNEVARKLDQNSEAFAQERTGTIALTSSAVGISSGLTIGYVIWLLRSGLLLSSVLTSLPAWRWVDPLPVLSTLDGDGDQKDDESLEEMVVNEGSAGTTNASNDPDIHTESLTTKEHTQKGIN